MEWDPDQNIAIYDVSLDSKKLGYAVIIDELGKHKPITLLIQVSSDKTIERISVLKYRESIGGQIKRRRFLNQFKSKSLNDTLLINQDIDGISGATISSWSVANAAKKALLLIQFLEG